MAEKRKQGRPSKYSAALDLTVEYMARAGLTDKQISEKLGITEATLNNWKKAHPSFFESLKRGKEDPDDMVEKSLFKMATGYSYKAQKPVSVSMGQGMGSEVQTVEYKEHVPPNPTSIIFWLKNRRPDRWRDKHDVETSGEVRVIFDKEDEDLV